MSIEAVSHQRIVGLTFAGLLGAGALLAVSHETAQPAEASGTLNGADAALNCEDGYGVDIVIDGFVPQGRWSVEVPGLHDPVYSFFEGPGTQPHDLGSDPALEDQTAVVYQYDPDFNVIGQDNVVLDCEQPPITTTTTEPGSTTTTEQETTTTTEQETTTTTEATTTTTTEPGSTTTTTEPGTTTTTEPGSTTTTEPDGPTTTTPQPPKPPVVTPPVAPPAVPVPAPAPTPAPAPQQGGGFEFGHTA